MIRCLRNRGKSNLRIDGDEGEARTTKIFLKRVRELSFREACESLAASYLVVEEAVEPDLAGTILAGLVLWSVARELSCAQIGKSEVAVVKELSRMGQGLTQLELSERLARAGETGEPLLTKGKLEGALARLTDLGVLVEEDGRLRLTEEPVISPT